MPIFRHSLSIQVRLLAATLLILPVLLGFLIWTLDRAFANYQWEAQAERMRLLQLLLAKATEWSGESWLVENLDEPRLALLNSGLYAVLLSPDGTVLWSSPSAAQIGATAEPVRRVAEVDDHEHAIAGPSVLPVGPAVVGGVHRRVLAAVGVGAA